jgi:hypothetical protein
LRETTSSRRQHLQISHICPSHEVDADTDPRTPRQARDLTAATASTSGDDTQVGGVGLLQDARSGFGRRRGAPYRITVFLTRQQIRGVRRQTTSSAKACSPHGRGGKRAKSRDDEAIPALYGRGGRRYNATLSSSSRLSRLQWSTRRW